MTSNSGSHGTQSCYFLTFDPRKIDQVRDVYIVAATLDAILILPTIALNVLLTISLYRSTEIRKPSTKLLFSLALSDVLVGLVVEPALLVKKIADLDHNFARYCITAMITHVAGGALGASSFMTLTAIAVDRYLAIHKGTKYGTLVTNGRVVCLVVVIWLVSCFLYCSRFYVKQSLYFKVAGPFMLLSVAMASYCYVKCLHTLKVQQRSVRCLNEGNERQTAMNTCRYKKSMYTMFYVFMAFSLCYLPFICTTVATIILGETAVIWGAESISSIFLFGNSLVNPIILFSRIKEIRKAVVMTMSMSSHHSNRNHQVIQIRPFHEQTGRRRDEVT